MTESANMLLHAWKADSHVLAIGSMHPSSRPCGAGDFRLRLTGSAAPTLDRAFAIDGGVVMGPKSFGT